jgi:AbrB family looped-hinge helix DNA binding protein
VKFLNFYVKNVVMSTVDVDSRGRVYLPKEIREKHGEKFKVIELESGIKLVPVSEDPVEGLKEAMGELKDVSPEEFEEAVREEAKEQI